MTVGIRIGAWFSLAALLACGRSGGSTEARGTSDAATATDSSAPARSTRPAPEPCLKPLGEASWLEELRVGNAAGAPDAGSADESIVAMVTVPLGATAKRPVVIAAHGAGDRADWACGGWRGVTDGYAFVLCPRGIPTGGNPTRYAWPSAAYLKKQIDAALLALNARFGPYIADGPLLFAGFSQGALLGARIVKESPSRFPRVILAEGGAFEAGQPTWTAAFKAGGGDRVLLACSQGGCARALTPASRTLTRGGVQARVNDAGNVGHNLNGEVITSLKRDVPWLIEGDPRWKGLTAGAGADACR